MPHEPWHIVASAAYVAFCAVCHVSLRGGVTRACRLYGSSAGRRQSMECACTPMSSSPPTRQRNLCHETAAYAGAAFLGRGAPSGGLALDGRSDAGSTNVLPFGPTRTASCSALPRRSPGQDRNHMVQPLSQAPPRGLPPIVTGSPGTASSVAYTHLTLPTRKEAQHSAVR